MRKTRVKERLRAEINIVPFTDVLLVLLVIFMVTTPLIVQGQIHVKLPSASSASPATPVRPVTLTLTATGKLYLNDAEVSMDQLPSFLSSALKDRDDKTVVINADTNSTHGRVVELLDAARTAGATRLAIATQNK
jgi:biopolymer transport protein TolR